MKNIAAASLVALALVATTAGAQSYPSRPVKVIVPFAPGGGVDVMGRLMAQALTTALGNAFVVENRPGVGGLLAIEAVANAPADGYTIGVGSAGSLSVSPTLFRDRKFDPVKQLEPVILFVNSPGLLIGRPDLPASNAAELVALARAKSGALNVGTSGNGTVLHLMGEFFAAKEGLKWTNVHYKGAGPALVDLSSSRVDLVMADVPSAATLVRSGRIKAIAVTTQKRSSQLPDVPTLEEAGYKGYDMGSWMGLVMPKGSPMEAVQKVNAVLDAALKSPETLARVKATGAEPEGGAPQRLGERIASEWQRWAEVIRTTNVKPE